MQLRRSVSSPHNFRPAAVRIRREDKDCLLTCWTMSAMHDPIRSRMSVLEPSCQQNSENGMKLARRMFCSISPFFEKKKRRIITMMNGKLSKKVPILITNYRILKTKHQMSLRPDWTRKILPPSEGMNSPE